MHAPAIWKPSLLPTCVILDRAPASFPEALSFNIEKLGSITADYVDGTDHHIVLESRRGHQRLWMHNCDCETKTSFTIPADANFSLRLAATQRFYRHLRGLKQRRLPPGISPTRYQRLRLIQLLQLLDAENEGMRRRDMAFQILYPKHDVPGNIMWKASHERRRMYRMLGDAHQLCASGYLTLLQGGTD